MTLSPPAVLDDDYDYMLAEPPDLLERLRRLRETKPAAWVKTWGKPTVMFTSFDLVDAAFRDADDGPWTVVDFKTDVQIGARHDDYVRQVALYARAIAEATGAPVAAVLLQL